MARWLEHSVVVDVAAPLDQGLGRVERPDRHAPLDALD